MSAGPNGSVTPARVPPVRYGESVRLKIQPKVGFHLDSLLVDGIPVRATDQLVLKEVTKNRAVRATFKKNEYTVVASAGTHASISPSGPITLEHGASQTFVLSAAPGYNVREVVVDGKPIRASGRWTLANIQGHHTVVARVAHSLANFVREAADEVWTIGEIREVHWQPLEGGLRDTVELRVSYHGGAGPWITIWRGPLRAGSAEWQVAGQETDSLMLCLGGVARGQVQGMDFGNGLIRVRSGRGDPLADVFYLRATPTPVTAGPVRIEYRHPFGSDATLEIYSVNGQQVWRQPLRNAAGEQSITWDGRVSGGERAGPGVYFARLVTGHGARQCRLVMLP